jgi:DNA-binding response OmpR family regulator
MAKILVIDDELQMRRLIGRILASAGHEVIEAADGNHGLKQFIAHRPNVVVTDIFMPDKEGIETIKELRRIAPTVRIVAISGGGAAHDTVFLEYAKALGADFALVKPFRADALTAAVEAGVPHADHPFNMVRGDPP